MAENESLQETLDILDDSQAIADLNQSQEDFESGDTYSLKQVRADLESLNRRDAYRF